MSRKLLSTGSAETLRQLVDRIEEACEMAGLRGTGITRNNAADVIYVTINSDAVRVQLIEETLTDGSKVYNLELMEACK